MWSSACLAAMPSARVVAGARRRAPAPRRVASSVVAGDPARLSPARARTPSALERRLADANATPVATRASASLATRLRRPRVVPAAVREPGERGYEPASTSASAPASDDAAARDEDDPRAVASGPAGPSPTAARRARDAARAADRYVAAEGEHRAREHAVAETRRTRPRGARPRADRTPSAATSSSAPSSATSSATSSPSKTPRSSTTTPRGRKSNRYNRPQLGGAKADADASSSAPSSASASASSSQSSADRPKWLSHQHTRRPGQQPQQRRKRGGNGGNGMRPGERIVEAMEALPSDVVAGVAEGDARRVDDDDYDYEYAYDGSGAPSSGSGAPGGSTHDDDDSFAFDYPGADDRDDSGDTSSSNRVRSARRSVHAAVSNISKFSAPTLNFAIKELGERGGFDRAHALYLWMLTQRGAGAEKYRPNRHTLVSLFGAASDRRHARVVVKCWRDATRFEPDEMRTNEVASAAIAALGRCENWPAAYQVWRDMGDAGEPRNLYAYTAILVVLREAKRWEEASDVFRAMRDEPGISPDAKCAGIMLAAHDAARRWREADAIAKRLVDVYDVALDEHLSHQIISIAGRAGNMAHAKAAFDRMRGTRSLVVTTYSYNCLLGGYARNGDWDGAKATLDELVAAHLRPDTYTFAHLVSAAERAGRYAEADDVWQRALASKIKPHTVMCGAYVHCLGCQGRWMEAEALVAQMRDKWGARRNAAVYNALLGALVRAEKIDKALRAFDQMQSEDGIIPTEITFMLLVRACADNGLGARAKELAAVRDALAETGALENDFSKYDANRSAVEGPGGGARAAGRGGGEESAGRLSAGLPPSW